MSRGGVPLYPLSRSSVTASEPSILGMKLSIMIYIKEGVDIK